MFGTSVARTLFHSSSGGRTASADEVFGGAPVPYLRSVDDPPDHVSPYHDWTVTLSDAEAARQLRPVLQGELLDVQVVARTASGRAATVRVTGTLGAIDVPGTTARQLLAPALDLVHDHALGDRLERGLRRRRAGRRAV